MIAGDATWVFCTESLSEGICTCLPLRCTYIPLSCAYLLDPVCQTTLLLPPGADALAERRALAFMPCMHELTANSAFKKAEFINL